jgi:pyruvate oxidase
MALGRFHPVEVPVLGHVGITARLLAVDFSAEAACEDQRPEVAERWAIWRDEKSRRRLDDFGGGVNSASVFDAMSAIVPDDAVLCVDVGNNAYSFGRYFEVSGHQDVLMSGYLGSIGFAFPAPMGAWAAVGTGEARRPVVSVSGDGVWQTGLHNPDFAAFAQLCGAAGYRVTRADQLATALSAALHHDGPALVEVLADPLLV